MLRTLFASTTSSIEQKFFAHSLNFSGDLVEYCYFNWDDHIKASSNNRLSCTELRAALVKGYSGTRRGLSVNQRLTSVLYFRTRFVLAPAVLELKRGPGRGRANGRKHSLNSAVGVLDCKLRLELALRSKGINRTFCDSAQQRLSPGISAVVDLFCGLGPRLIF
jgi:hypothetical protein